VVFNPPERAVHDTCVSAWVTTGKA